MPGLTAAKGSSSASLDDLRNALLRASAFGIAGTIPVSAVGISAQGRTDLISQGESVAREMNNRLQRISKLSAGITPETQRDYELARFSELFGGDFRVLSWTTAPNAAILKHSFSNSVSLQGGNPME